MNTDRNVLGMIGALGAFTVALVDGMADEEGGVELAAGDTAAVSLTEFAISPDAVSIGKGGSLEITNDGTIDHNLAVKETDRKTPDFGPGESATLDLTTLEAGEYEIYCAVPGHADAGMKATLTVGEEGATGAAGAASGGEPKSTELTKADYERMSKAMNDSIKAFPAKTKGVGNQPLEPKILADGTKELAITAKIAQWEVEPGKTVDAWTYNGMVPGPMIRLEVGDKVRVNFRNELPMGTDVHWHGIDTPNAMDGVAPLTQPLVEPGESFVYEFTTTHPAVGMYHAHHHGQMQVVNGLFATFFVGDVALPRGRTIDRLSVPADLQVAQEVPMVLNDAGAIGYSLNGKSFPATAPITAKKGDWLLVHYFNEGTQAHPMHMHQFDQIVVNKDGFNLDSPYVADTLNVAPGERYSVLLEAKDPGAWVWHCHILPHVERETGVFGMLTAVIVE